MADELILSRYRILKEIGSGGFGRVYKALDTKTTHEVAIKIQKGHAQELQDEAKTLRKLSGGKGIPEIYKFGTREQCSYLIEQLLGPSLATELKQSKKNFPPEVVCTIGRQLLNILQFVHSHGIVHRDIKPHQILLTNSLKRVYLVDYGLATKYMYGHMHIPYIGKCRVVGSCQFASINAHRAARLSRRDDLESLMYTLIYLIRGHLPWTQFSHENNWVGACSSKVLTPLADICQKCPANFQALLAYTRQLKYTEAPDYQYMKNMLKCDSPVLLRAWFKPPKPKKPKQRPQSSMKRSKTCIQDSEVFTGLIRLNNPFRSTPFLTQTCSTTLGDLPEFKEHPAL